MNPIIKRVLIVIITASLYIAAFYFDIEGAQNIIIFVYSIMTALLTIVYASMLYGYTNSVLSITKQSSHFVTAEPSIRTKWFRGIWQTVLCATLVWSGFLGTAFIYILGIIVCYQLESLAKTIREEALSDE